MYDPSNLSYITKYGSSEGATQDKKSPSRIWKNKVLGEIKSSNILIIQRLFCSKNILKRTIKEVGFNVFSIAGPTGKREITLACKN